MSTPYLPDLLPGFEQASIPLPADPDGPVEATLVRRLRPGGSERAVLYVHGYNDYFFQTEMADRWNAAGFDFYALDLRRYGRSFRPSQLLCFVRDLHLYFLELDAAVERIRADGHRLLVLSGHSTGGLTSGLYAHHRRDRGTIDALVLNAPFLAFSGTKVERIALRSVFSRVGRLDPRWIVQKDGGPLYAWSLHEGFGKGGEWTFDLNWKRAGGLPVYAGWVRAVHKGQEEVRRGLAIACPVFVVSSARSGGGKEWDASWLETDAVLDMVDVRRLAWGLGAHVTQRSLKGALHDVILSRADVREQAYAAMVAWTVSVLPS